MVPDYLKKIDQSNYWNLLVPKHLIRDWCNCITRETGQGFKFKSTAQPFASSRFFSFARTSLTTITHFQQRTAREVLHSFSLHCNSFSPALAVTHAHPNAGKVVFRLRSTANKIAKPLQHIFWNTSIFKG